MRRFRLRRLWRVNCEALMRAAGQNLKRLLKKWGWRRRPWPEGAANAAFSLLSFLLSSTLSLASGTLLWLDLGTNDRKSWGRLAYPKINSSVEFFNKLGLLYTSSKQFAIIRLKNGQIACDHMV